MTDLTPERLAAENERLRTQWDQLVRTVDRVVNERNQARAEARATQELLRALRLAVVTIRAAWVEAERIGADEGIEVLEDVVLATAPDLPDLDQYDGGQAVFDAEYTAADRTTDAKRLRARLAAKEA